MPAASRESVVDALVAMDIERSVALRAVEETQAVGVGAAMRFALSDMNHEQCSNLETRWRTRAVQLRGQQIGNKG